VAPTAQFLEKQWQKHQMDAERQSQASDSYAIRPNPVGTITRHFGDLPYSFPLSQQPDYLKVTPLDRVSCLSVTILQFTNADVCSNTDIFGHQLLLLSKSNLFKRRFFLHFVFGEGQQWF